MPSTKRAILPFALIAALALPAGAQSTPDPETVMARVNGEEITLGHMILAYANLPEQYRSIPMDVLFPGLLDQLVQQTALMQSASDDPTPFIELALENERRVLTAGEAARGISESVTEEDIRAAYDEKYAGSGTTEYNASHILLETEEEAQEVITMLEEGADFARLAKERSTGPSGPDGGSLGWFAAGAMVAPFESAVMELEPGEVSGPVKTQFGWHVIILNEERVSEAPAFEEVRGQIAQELQQEAITRAVTKLVDASEVERPEHNIPPEALQDLGLVQN
ncbi:peptidylprolyl isomerase [Chachezhania antarctica]|uniref:peptidylprolyl isomerase n=1 Tax=Chachezhania antarctica TaxID=2340860 RepID=UPI000EAD3A66|nr:peptidylprolyl isomerase [Chachezhania antarctica]